MEVSQKFSCKDINHLAFHGGFQRMGALYDRKRMARRRGVASQIEIKNTAIMKAADSGAMEASNWKKRYEEVRNLSLTLCQPLETEDFVVQPIVEVSPPKWHLGHTTWFFETFVLIPYANNYQVFNTQYNYLFNSYYEGVGRRIARNQRGNLSRPTVAEVYTYREYVDSQMQLLLNNESLDSEIIERVELGLNHEQQHQELLISDITIYFLVTNPYSPSFKSSPLLPAAFPRRFL